MNLIIIGAPASGKGTLSKQIVKEYGIPQISTGDILRANMRQGTDLGKIAERYIKEGNYLPDHIVCEVVRDRLMEDDCKKGFILDGFPRTIVQADELAEFAKIDGVLLIDLPLDIVVERSITRRVCTSCGEIYNTSRYDKSTCKKCGAPLYQRDDDKLETVKNRLEVYEKQTAPLIDFYSDKLCRVSSAGTPEETFAQVKTFLDKLEDKK